MLKRDKVVGEDLNLGIANTTIQAPSGGTLPGTQLSLTSLAIGGAKGYATTATWNPSSVSAAQSTTTTVNVPGAQLGDFALASFSLDLAGCTMSAYISSANTVTVVISNPTTAAIDLASGTVRVLVFHTR